MTTSWGTAAVRLGVPVAQTPTEPPAEILLPAKIPTTTALVVTGAAVVMQALAVAIGVVAAVVILAGVAGTIKPART